MSSSSAFTASRSATAMSYVLRATQAPVLMVARHSIQAVSVWIFIPWLGVSSCCSPRDSSEGCVRCDPAVSLPSRITLSSVKLTPPLWEHDGGETHTRGRKECKPYDNQLARDRGDEGLPGRVDLSRSANQMSQRNHTTHMNRNEQNRENGPPYLAGRGYAPRYSPLGSLWQTCV